jgi:hypothetical protein
MYIRLQDTLINLDLVKKIDDVTAHHYQNKSDRIHSGKEYIELKPMEAVEEVKFLALYADPDKNKKKFEVRYFIKVWYIGEDRADFVNCGTNRHDAQKLHTAFSTLVNGNKPITHHLKI